MANLMKLAQDLQFNFKNKYANGKYNGYDVALEQSMANPMLFSFQVEPLDASQYNQFVAFLNNNKKQLKMNQYRIKDHMISISWFGSFSPMNAKIATEYLDLVTSELRRLSIYPNDSCVLCGEKDNLTEITINGVKMKAHQECKDSEILKLKQDISNEPITEKHLFNGIIGAFIGAIIGSIPWILIEILTGFYAAVLGILIGYSAFFLYKTFGGPLNKNTKFIILIATLFGVFFTNIALASYVIIISGGGIMIANYIICYTDPDISSMLFTDLFIGLAMTAFAIPAIFKKVISSEKPKTIIE